LRSGRRRSVVVSVSVGLRSCIGRLVRLLLRRRLLASSFRRSSAACARTAAPSGFGGSAAAAARGERGQLRRRSCIIRIVVRIGTLRWRLLECSSRSRIIVARLLAASSARASRAAAALLLALARLGRRSSSAALQLLRSQQFRGDSFRGGCGCALQLAHYGVAAAHQLRSSILQRIFQAQRACAYGALCVAFISDKRKQRLISVTLH
jgi:hypothetical protein